MTDNQYKATSEYGRAIFGEDVFDADFDATEEKDHLDGGHLEIVPRDYEVVSNNFTDGPKGSFYRAAYPKDVEEALIGGYHLKRAEKKPPEKKSAAKKAAKKAAAESKKDDD